MSDRNPPFSKPQGLEYPEHFRPGLGTELVAPFLRSMVQMVRPNRVLEVGAGYTTPFLLEALVNNQRVLDDGNLYEPYFKDYCYDPKLVIIDDMSLGDLITKPGMQAVLHAPYVEFIEGMFQGQAQTLAAKYGQFDFVWFDCGGAAEYQAFLDEYWDICSNYLFFHFTHTEGQPNANLDAVLAGIKDNPTVVHIVEPHKKQQGSITMVRKGDS